MKHASRSAYFMISFFIVIVLLAIIGYLQAFEGFTPCPLCILQRFVLMILGAIFCLGAIMRFKKRGRLVTHGFALIFASLGAALAGRQVWLQHLPINQSRGCEASLDYMLQSLPLKEVLTKILQGSSECSQVGVEFLHISFAGWSLIIFSAFVLTSFWKMVRITLRQFP